MEIDPDSQVLSASPFADKIEIIPEEDSQSF